jgi:hypothetical protein
LAGDVRSDVDFRMGLERMILGQRFGLEHVQGRRLNVTALQRSLDPSLSTIGKSPASQVITMAQNGCFGEGGR